MRIIEYKNKKARLSDEELQVILNRFDVDKARAYGNTWVISAWCICQYYPEECRGCPFWQLNGNLGCMEWMRSKAAEGKLVCHLYQDRIEWQDSDDYEARRQVQKLREAYINLPQENEFGKRAE